MTTHLIIPDAHSKPNQSLRRFRWLGRYIVDHKPDSIICIGDFADMHSLSSYDVGKKAGEGARYLADIEAADAAMSALMTPLMEYNEHRRLMKKAQYKPKLILTLGNHENRINRHIENYPILDGLLSTDSLNYAEYGWEVYNFLDRVEHEGITYAHYFTSGVMGRPIGGEHHATSLINKQHTSCVVGHSHLRDFSERTDANGNRIIGVVVGCYLEEYEAYAGPANLMWWKGIVSLNNVDGKGGADPEFISLDTLQEIYGQDN